MDDSSECDCNWHCSCKVVLGKRPPTYYKEYQEYLRQLSKSPRKDDDHRDPLTVHEGQRATTTTQNDGNMGQVVVADPILDQVKEIIEKREEVEHQQVSDKQDGQELKVLGTEDEDQSHKEIKEERSSVFEVIIEQNKDERSTFTVSGKNSSGEDCATTSVVNDDGPSVEVRTATTCLKSSNKAAPTTAPNEDQKVMTNSLVVPINESSTPTYNYRNRSQFHKCSSCGKMFGQLISLQRHEKEHVLEAYKHFKCPDCGKQYATLASYERHMRVHPKCLLCGKALTVKEVESQPEEENLLNLNVCKKCRNNDHAPAPMIRKKSHGNGVLSRDMQSNGQSDVHEQDCHFENGQLDPHCEPFSEV